MIENIMIGEMKHLDDCVIALENSELGSVYFSKKNKAMDAIREGISKREIYIAIDNKGVCIGFMWYIPYGAFHAFPYLHIIAVKEAYRGIGIGSDLLKYFEEKIANSSKVFLVVGDFNLRAKLLYEKLGYKEVGVIPNLYKKGVVEYLMMKDL